jgi:hypothetical protein
VKSWLRIEVIDASWTLYGEPRNLNRGKSGETPTTADQQPLIKEIQHGNHQTIAILGDDEGNKQG